jgi:hypothetical protein
MEMKTRNAFFLFILCSQWIVCVFVVFVVVPNGSSGHGYSRVFFNWMILNCHLYLGSSSEMFCRCYISLILPSSSSFTLNWCSLCNVKCHHKLVREKMGEREIVVYCFLRDQTVVSRVLRWAGSMSTWIFLPILFSFLCIDTKHSSLTSQCSF